MLYFCNTNLSGFKCVCVYNFLYCIMDLCMVMLTVITYKSGIVLVFFQVSLFKFLAQGNNNRLKISFWAQTSNLLIASQTQTIQLNSCSLQCSSCASLQEVRVDMILLMEIVTVPNS